MDTDTFLDTAETFLSETKVALISTGPGLSPG